MRHGARDLPSLNQKTIQGHPHSWSPTSAAQNATDMGHPAPWGLRTTSPCKLIELCWSMLLDERISAWNLRLNVNCMQGPSGVIFTNDRDQHSPFNG